MGRFDDSIAQYRKALSIDPHFVPSHFGISADLMYMGKPAQADGELQQMANQARNDGELRTALFGMAVVAADSGKFDKAAQDLDKEFAVAEKKNDAAAMAADLQAKGNILAQTTNLDQAKQAFDQSLQLIEGSSLSQEIKDNAKLAPSLQSRRGVHLEKRLRGGQTRGGGIPSGRRSYPRTQRR